MTDYGASDTSTTTLGANQFPISEVYTPNTGLRALEGGPATTDGAGKPSAPASVYAKDGSDVTQGTKADAAATDSTSAWSVVAMLKGLYAKLAGTLTISGAVTTSGTVTEANSAASKADLDTIVTNTNKIPASPATEGGHLATLDSHIPAQGQALAAASMPVVLTAAQITTLTPPAAISGFTLEAGHIATIDSHTPALGQALAAASVPIVLTAIQQTALTPPAAITGFALEAGHLATIDTHIPAQGQALAAASMPVVLTAAQITTLTPPAAITGFTLEAGHIATIDTSTAASKTDLDTIVTNTNKIPASPAQEAGNLASILTQVTNHTVLPGNTPNTTPWLASDHDGTTKAQNATSTGTNANGAARLVAGAYQEIAGQAAGSVTSTSTDLVPSFDFSAYSFAVLEMSGTWSMTLQAQWSNDNVNFTAGMVANGANTNLSASTITANGQYIIPKMGRFLRIRPSVWTSNASGVGTLECYTQPTPQLTSSVNAVESGTWTVQPGNTPNTTPWLVSAGPPADLTLIASGARTTTQTVADQANFAGKGLRVVLDMTTVGTGSVTLTINAKDVASGKYVLLLAGVAVTTNSTNVYVIHPELTAAANSIAKDVVPHTWQVVVTANNANSCTYSVGASYLN